MIPAEACTLPPHLQPLGPTSALRCDRVITRCPAAWAGLACTSAARGIGFRFDTVGAGSAAAGSWSVLFEPPGVDTECRLSRSTGPGKEVGRDGGNAPECTQALRQLPNAEAGARSGGRGANCFRTYGPYQVSVFAIPRCGAPNGASSVARWNERSDRRGARRSCWAVPRANVAPEPTVA